MIGPEHNLRSGGFSDLLDNLLVVLQVTVNMKDQQVGIERVEVMLGGASQRGRRKATDGRIPDFQIRLGVSFLDIRGHLA